MKPLSAAELEKYGAFEIDESQEDYQVEEIPNSEIHDSPNSESTSQQLQHSLFKVQKNGVSTWTMLKTLSSNLQGGIKLSEIGFAQQQDRNCLSSQFISVPNRFRDAIQNKGSYPNFSLEFVGFTPSKMKVKKKKKKLIASEKKIENKDSFTLDLNLGG